MQKFTGFDLQRNALRTETASMIEPVRCGWNIKPGAIGGRPLDYEPCIFVAHARTTNTFVGQKQPKVSRK